MIERVKIAEGGRIVLPVKYRRALGVDVGDEVCLEQDLDQGIRIFTLDQAVERSQKLIAKYAQTNRSLVSELIAERRQEAERE